MAFNLKDYEEVKDRIPRFWEKHTDGAIVTELIFHDDRQYIVQAALINGAGQKIATGLAEEIVGSSPVNKTSALENCETSAIGRALANAGFSSGKNRPSREEMDKSARGDSPGGAGDGGTAKTRPSSPGRRASEPQMKFLNTLVAEHYPPEGCPWPLTQEDGKTWLELPAAQVSAWLTELKEVAKEPKAERKSTLRDEVVPDPVVNAIKDKLDAEFSEEPF